MSRPPRSSEASPLFIGRDWTLGRAARRSAAILRTSGAVELWFKILGETVYRRISLWERLLEENPAKTPPAKPDGIELGDLQPAELDACVTLRADHPKEELQQRLARDERCFVARHSGRVVAMIWASNGGGWSDYLDAPVELGPDDHYLYEATVQPECRGHGIAPALILHAFRELSQSGSRRAVFAVNLENRAALAAFGRVGASRFALQGVVRLGSWRHDFLRTESTASEPQDRETSLDSAYWSSISRDTGRSDLLVELRCRAYARLLARWAPEAIDGWVLKTDLFEEASRSGPTLADLPADGAPRLGIDIGSGLVRAARSQPSQGSYCHVVGDVRALPLAERSMGFILSPSTLDHFADPTDLGRSLRELRRVLRTNGVLVLTLDNRQNVFDPLLRLAARAGALPFYVGRSYTVREMCDELRAAGFVVEETTSLVQHPRMLGVALAHAAKALGSPSFDALVRSAFLRAEALEDSPARYFTGCFVAARARVASPGETRDD